MKKRTLTLILALVLALCLSVTAFAHNLPNHPAIPDGEGYADLQIKNGSTTLFNDEVEGDTLYDAIVALSDDDVTHTVDAQWTDVRDYNYAQNGYMHKALTSLYGLASTYGTTSDLTNHTYQTYTVTESDYVAPGYYDLHDSGPDGAYHYLYIGMDWTYTVDGFDVYDYMCDLALDGQSIVLTYAPQLFDWYTDYQIIPQN